MVERCTQADLPPRTSSLYPVMAPRTAPPPIPLSRMTFEELMEILPRLDAAIIANDWLPCMQKRQKKIKKTIQAQSDCLQATRARSQDLGEDLMKTIDEVAAIATSFHALFEMAKELQQRDLHSSTAELDEANSKRSEAVSVLARHVSMHHDRCAAYERQIAELQSDVKQAVRVLGSFIHENLSAALDSSPEEQIEEILEKFIILDNDTDALSNLVSKQLYHDTEKVLSKAQSERDSLRELCTQQMNTIRGQSQEMDQYVTRMAQVISLVQEKEEAGHKLRLENDVFRQEVLTLKNALSKAQVHHELVNHTNRDTSLSQECINTKDWSHDAEITNLRSKLAHSLDRERDLNQQIRQLLQSSHGGRPDKRSNRIRRLLTGNGPAGHEYSLFFPRGNSMLDLSRTSLYPNDNGISPILKSDKLSPDPATSSSDSTYAPLELPTFFDSRNPPSPIQLPSRLRAAPAGNQLGSNHEIESAVSGRFHLSSNRGSDKSVAMPANVRIAERSPLISANEPWKSTSKPASSDHTQNPEEYYRNPRPNDTKGRLPRSPSMLLFDSHQENRHVQHYPRVLSGITEVSETETTDFKRRMI